MSIGRTAMSHGLWGMHAKSGPIAMICRAFKIICRTGPIDSFRGMRTHAVSITHIVRTLEFIRGARVCCVHGGPTLMFRRITLVPRTFIVVGLFPAVFINAAAGPRNTHPIA